MNWIIGLSLWAAGIALAWAFVAGAHKHIQEDDEAQG